MLAGIPSAVTVVRIARREYLAVLAWVTRHRRMWLFGRLMAERLAAAEVRTYQLRDFLLGEYRRMMRIDRRAQLGLVRAQTGTRIKAGACHRPGSPGPVRDWPVSTHPPPG